MDEFLFYDIEVFHSDSFVLFKNKEKQLLKVFHNNFTELYKFIEGKTLVGYNNYWYDDHILHAMLNLHTPAQIKELNDRIIGGEPVRTSIYKFNSLDCFQQILTMPSLKKVEGNLGKMILESSVPFTIQRKLNDDEIKEVIEYCSYDIDTTIDVFKIRENDYFKPKKALVDMLDNDNAMRWNTTTLSANVLLKKPLVKWSNIRVPEELLNIVPPEVKELWLTKDKGSIRVHEFDNELVFGFGGLHGQNTKKKYFENVINLDVASLYPSIIVNHNILGAATEKYKEILEERIRIKHTEPDRQAGLKLILNSVYGLLKSKYSILFNAKASTTVCAIGQAMLYDLSKRLSHTCEIVQVNTDGVAFIPCNDEYKTIWKEWERDYNLTLEEDVFAKFWQSNVNNYIAMTPEGKLKTKGGDVNRYKKDAVFNNNNARILDIALVDFLTKGKDVIDTLRENTDNPMLYQYILQAGRTYQGTFDAEDNEHNRINRVFPTKKEGTCLYKKRLDGGLVRYADAPLNMFVWNDDCDKLENFKEIIDLNHYYQIIQKRLEKWT